MDEVRTDVEDDGRGVIGSQKSTTLLSRSLSKVSNATYNTKKTMAQGMMDIALLTANANQLRYILEFRHDKSTNFVILLILIACSLILQVKSARRDFICIVRNLIRETLVLFNMFEYTIFGNWEINLPKFYIIINIKTT